MLRSRNLIQYGTTHPEMYKTELDLCKEKLVASQAREKQMRDALINANEQLIAWRENFPQYADSEEVACQIDEALALPADNTALREYVAPLHEALRVAKEVLIVRAEFDQTYPPNTRPTNREAEALAKIEGMIK